MQALVDVLEVLSTQPPSASNGSRRFLLLLTVGRSHDKRDREVQVFDLDPSLS
jgi:hypothetical protein